MKRWFVSLILLFSVLPAQAQTNVENLESLYEARPKFDDDAEKLVRAKPTLPDDYELLYRMARLVYYVGFFILDENKDKDLRVDLYDYATQLADRARKLEPKRVEGHYWFAVNRGGFGLAKGIMASLKGARPMQEALDKAVEIDGAYHFAGPHRVRGRMYFKLPGGIISFGDNDKALADLEKAVQISPVNRLNHIYLSEVLAKEKTKKDALKTLEAAEKLPDVAGSKEEIVYRKELLTLQKKFSN